MKRYDQDFMKKFYVLYIMIYCQYIKREREREEGNRKEKGAKRIIKRERERERENRRREQENNK